MTARRERDDKALTFSLWGRHDAIWGPGTAPEREALPDPDLLDLLGTWHPDFAAALRASGSTTSARKA